MVHLVLRDKDGWPVERIGRPTLRSRSRWHDARSGFLRHVSNALHILFRTSLWQTWGMRRAPLAGYCNFSLTAVHHWMCGFGEAGK